MKCIGIAACVDGVDAEGEAVACQVLEVADPWDAQNLIRGFLKQPSSGLKKASRRRIGQGCRAIASGRTKCACS